ncbi:T-lymphocyte surface antigen Ly-9 [Fukomys damarensis]|uniref:T-lymphocyte surface antigen Ly-9 n=1 Tax=Fukomys damarensis TaxID=885580 RepID=A0A091CI99_FUKDA|nr:T-lymphocyte surface antigen Ly-9 [Fukomys damarensis]
MNGVMTPLELGASGKDADPTVVSGILGSSVTLSLNVSRETDIEHVSRTGHQNALVFALPKECPVFMDKSYKGQLDIDGWSFSLHLRNLTQKDAGPYKAQINQHNSSDTIEKEFILYVYEGQRRVCSGQIMVAQDTKKVVRVFNTSVISKEKEAATADLPAKPQGHNESRVSISSQDYSLKISRLKMEDAGPYRAYVCSEASEVPSMKHVTLLIYRKLKKPKITWSPLSPKDGICRANLTCSVEDGGDTVTYTWTFQKGVAVSPEGSYHIVSWRSHANLYLHSQKLCQQQLFPVSHQEHLSRHESASTSDTSSDSSITTEEDEDRTKVHLAVGGRDKITRKHPGYDLASEGQRSYEASTPDYTAVKSVDKQDVEHVQVFTVMQVECETVKTHLVIKAGLKWSVLEKDLSPSGGELSHNLLLCSETSEASQSTDMSTSCLPRAELSAMQRVEEICGFQGFINQIYVYSFGSQEVPPPQHALESSETLTYQNFT